MKKPGIINLFLPMMLLMALSVLAACGKTSPVEDEGLIRVGFSQVGAESDWRTANTKSVTEALTEENGFELLFDNAKQHQENQLLAIRNFIQQGVDYIVLAPIAESGWNDVLQEAKVAGIPVIIAVRQLAVEDRSLYTCFVGSDNLTEGRKATQWLEEELQRQGREDSPLHILHIRGTDGSTPQLMRSKALEDAVASHPGWEIVGSLPGEFTDAKSYELVRDFLKTGENIDVIYSENDNMTFGALRALDEAGISYTGEDHLIIISFDAVRDALRSCLAGNIDLCVECNPLQGPIISKLIKELEAGIQVPKETYVEEAVFSSDTLTEEILSKREY